MIRKKLLCVSLAAVMAVMSFAACSGSKNNDTSVSGVNTTDISTEAVNNSDKDYGLTADIKDGTILQCFCWSFNTISESMEDIAAAGYSAIQTSPINACYDGGNAGMELFGDGKWSYVYQPTDWTIGNYQLGTEEEFKKMCSVAESYGIKVIVDVVPNHTTTTLDAVSDKFIEAVGGKDKMYHSDGMKDIEDYGDRKQCTLQGVGGLPDVDTENEKFQKYFLSYLNQCIKDGADGFRYDTAKHIGLKDDPKDKDGDENNFWDNILTSTDNADKIFNYGEVLQGDNDRIEDYIDKIGATTASNYGMTMRLAVENGSVDADEVKDLCIDGGKDSVVTWAESHDNYCGDDHTYNISNEDISLTWAIIAARAKGTPLFFSRPYGNTVENMWGTMNRIGCAGDYIYKNKVVSAANHFRNAMSGEEENIFNPDTDKQVVCVERGSKGITIVNAGDKDAKITFFTSLADGTYTDRVDGETEYTVKDGEISCDIKGKSAVILYNEGFKELGIIPEVKVADKTEMKITEDAVSVVLKASNVKEATYSIDGGKETSYKDGGNIIIGDNMSGGDTLSLTLRGISEDGNRTCMTYVFSKKDGVAKGTKIYFEKPSGWKDEVYAYVYDETSSSVVKYNAEWPGAEMKDEGNGKYSYTFTEEWTAPLVIFTDGDNQSNGAMEPGANVEADKVYTVK